MGILADIPNASPEDALFPDVNKSGVAKIRMVKAWMDHVNVDVTGHSSGAMCYTRCGLATQEIASLGRWRSSAVFRYIEEAPRVPLNRAMAGKSNEEKPPEVSQEREPVGQNRAPENGEGNAQRVVEVQVAEKPKLTQLPNKQCLVIPRSRVRAVVHLVRQAAWDFPFNKWGAWCGWRFAERNVKVALVTRIPQGIQRCKKCEADGAKGGVSLASLIQLSKVEGAIEKGQ